MTEPIPSIVPLEPGVPAYKDRSTGLIIFGILTILLGCLSGLLIILMVAGQAISAKTAQTPNAAAILPAIAIYGVLAVALIWLGIGSLQARRWARALLLIFSWSWLMMGIVTSITMGGLLPTAMKNSPTAPGQPPMPTGAIGAAMVFVFLFLGFFFLALPTIWIFFYGSRHVKSTCEVRDPMPRWTDACPLPVLGLCIWQILGVPIMLIMPATGHCVMPFFGALLTGLIGKLLYLICAVVWGYAAWLMYHLRSQGWWLMLVTLIVFLVSGCITFTRHGTLEIYQLMDYSQAQIDQIKQAGLMSGNWMVWMSVLCILPFLAYLLYIKKYFRASL